MYDSNPFGTSLRPIIRLRTIKAIAQWQKCRSQLTTIEFQILISFNRKPVWSLHSLRYLKFHLIQIRKARITIPKYFHPSQFNRKQLINPKCLVNLWWFKRDILFHYINQTKVSALIKVDNLTLLSQIKLNRLIATYRLIWPIWSQIWSRMILKLCKIASSSLNVVLSSGPTKIKLSLIQ